MQIKLGFIGCGNMATAIINGAVSSQFIAGEDIFVYDIDEVLNNDIDVVVECLSEENKAYECAKKVLDDDGNLKKEEHALLRLRIDEIYKERANTIN